MRSSIGRLTCLALVLAAAGGASTIIPDLADAQSIRAAPSMPSISVSPMGPRSPDFRTPPSSGGGTYTTQSYTTQQSTGGGNNPPPRQVKKKIDPPQNQPPRVTRLTSGIPPLGERRFVPNEVVIEVNGQPSQQLADALARRHGLTRVESLNMGLTGTTMFRWSIPDGRGVREVIRALENDVAIKDASPNFRYILQQTPAPASAAVEKTGDPAQYALDKLQLRLAHSLATGAEIRVAVIDSGIDPSHPELAGTIVATLDTLEPGEPHTH